ncbi:hypothetical protein V1509DRAFT_636774, partial [Lipomyces kononenkoae]
MLGGRSFILFFFSALLCKMTWLATVITSSFLSSFFLFFLGEGCVQLHNVVWFLDAVPLLLLHSNCIQLLIDSGCCCHHLLQCGWSFRHKRDLLPYLFLERLVELVLKSFVVPVEVGCNLSELRDMVCYRRKLSDIIHLMPCFVFFIDISKDHLELFHKVLVFGKYVKSISVSLIWILEPISQVTIEPIHGVSFKEAGCCQNLVGFTHQISLVSLECSTFSVEGVHLADLQR